MQTNEGEMDVGGHGRGTGLWSGCAAKIGVVGLALELPQEIRKARGGCSLGISPRRGGLVRW